ncbi:MAG: ABC transporter substrate-binding protein [Clostridium sp.]|jgi:branched-chain amino acid transport system substrate-binding protein|nr:ABC transporter substrate-binding protein [Clostridium sp.]
MKKSVYRLSALLLFVILMAGCGRENLPITDSAGTIKIGVFQPLTGAHAAGGELELKGIRLANKLYPEVLGKKIELIEGDNKSDRVEAVHVASSLVNNRVSAVLGSWGSTMSIAGGPVFANAKIPVIAASATNPKVTLGNKYYYRVCFIDSFQGTVMANYTYDELAKTKVGILREINSEYSVDLANFFAQQYKERGGTIVATYDFKKDEQDFKSILTQLKSSGAEVIFAPSSYTEASHIINQARDMGIELDILGGDTWENPELINQGGSAIEGIIFSTFFDKDHSLTNETNKFMEAWEIEYPNEEVAAASILAYDAYLMAYKAMESAGSANPGKIQEALNKVEDFQGAAGVVNFDENRNAIKGVVIKQVKNGAFTFLDVVEP